LHEWVRNNRSLILSALYALVKNWIDNGIKPGSKPFASYPEWARVCGGIMESAGYNSPCVLGAKSISVVGDTETSDMKVLFELCHAQHANDWIKREEILRIIRTEDIFSHLNLSEHSDIIIFGKQLSKFIGRILSDITLQVDNEQARGSRQKYRFFKAGEDNVR